MPVDMRIIFLAENYPHLTHAKEQRKDFFCGDLVNSSLKLSELINFHSKPHWVFYSQEFSWAYY